MEGTEADTIYRIIQPVPGQLVLKAGRSTIGMFSLEGGYTVARKILETLGWREGDETGVKVGLRDPKPVSPEAIESTLRRIKASGVSIPVNIHHRQTLWGPWGPLTDPEPLKRVPGVTSVMMGETPMTARPRPEEVRKARLAAREAMAAHLDRGLIPTTLFADVEEQLRYEIRHLYLHIVLEPQRPTYPLPTDYRILPQFMQDLSAHGKLVSRAQMLSAIIDVLTTKVWDTNSRKARALRQGIGGEVHRPQVCRPSDGGLAWRANVSSGTPAARRIMWWSRPDGGVDLARLTTHDDYEIPER